MPDILLASASPRRRELLLKTGLLFRVEPSGVREAMDPRLPAWAGARMLAWLKARDVALRFPGAVVIGADTLVVIGGRALGKPRSAGEARDMLELLSGRTHQVITGLAVLSDGGERAMVGHELTEVTMRNIASEEMDWYISTGEPMDKAGAYAVQGLGCRFVEAIKGCYYNVVGLPVARLAVFLQEFGVGRIEETWSTTSPSRNTRRTNGRGNGC